MSEPPDPSGYEQRLADLEALGLRRHTRLVSGPQGPRVTVDGRAVVLLCSNNYLGLADHPRVRTAAAEAAMRWGAGAGASRLVSGTMPIHTELERRLATFERTEAAVLFGSGYLANQGVIAALAAEGTVFSDELNHASIVDGCRLARARTFVYRHADTEHLAWGLREAARGPAVIVTDSVFSMDGDVAPLAELAELARRHRARLVVDEAHGTGALGPGGRGALAEAGVHADVVVGTLGKALGSYGAYACGSAALADFLVNVARPFIFSTAPPPPALAAALAALEVLEGEPERVARLAANADLLRDELAREGFQTAGSTTQIIPLVVGAAETAVSLSEAAIEEGVFAQAIRPPTVPDGTSRLRLAVMATHEREDLRHCARALGRAAVRVGFRPGTGMPVAAAQGPVGVATTTAAQAAPAVPRAA